jgi:germination protein M
VSTSRTRLRAVAATVSLLLVVATGCGVSSQSSPQRIQPKDVPFGLLRSRDSTTTSMPPGATTELGVWFVGPDGLTSVVREVRDGPTGRDLVDALTAGPSADEAHAGYRSALVPRSIDDVRIADGLATVELDAEFLQLGRVEQGFAIAQIVYTLTELNSVDRVRLLVDGEPLPVVQTNGRTSAAPISREDVVIPKAP